MIRITNPTSTATFRRKERGPNEVSKPPKPPRIPMIGVPARFPWPTKISTAMPLSKRGRLKHVKRNHWTARRLDYNFLESLKHVVDAIPYRYFGGKLWSEIHVSFMPWSRAGYVDIRLYNARRACGATSRGILIHIDKWDRLLGAMIACDRFIQTMRDQGLIESKAEQEERIAEREAFLATAYTTRMPEAFAAPAGGTSNWSGGTTTR